MQHSLVFSTSKVKTREQTASNWLDSFAGSFGFLNPQNDATWLAPGAAAEIRCRLDEKQIYPEIMHSQEFLTLRQQAHTAKIDVNLVSTKNRRKGLLIADMDSTIITSESLDELAKAAGIGEQITYITQRSIAGEIDFEAALEKRVAMLAGKPKTLIDTMIANCQLTAGACTLVQTMRAHGAFCYLVSGGFDALTAPIAAKCGFHSHHANHLECSDKIITGKVRKPILNCQAKVKYLMHYCAFHNVDISDSTCIGDGANDLGMLTSTNFGVAFKGKSILRKKIPLQINHTDLSGLLFLQGYKLGQFVKATVK